MASRPMAILAAAAALVVASRVILRLAHASRRAVMINIGFGDFVEACYPHMERSARVNIAAYAGAALAGAVLLAAGDAPGPPRSSAYLPMPLAAAVSDQPGSFALAAMLAFTVPFALSLGA